MVHKLDSEGKAKPRGKPFQKGHSIRKPKSSIVGTSGRASGDEGGIVVPAPIESIEQPIMTAIGEPIPNNDNSILLHLPKLLMENMDAQLKERMNTPLAEEGGYIDVPQKVMDELKPLELIESMDFKNGENTLQIRFSKKNNRMFRIQIFLNDQDEIRPVTYNGSSTAYSFWNLLKRSLKK